MGVPGTIGSLASAVQYCLVEGWFADDAIIWMEDPLECDLYFRQGRALVPFPWKDSVEGNNQQVSLVKKKHTDKLGPQ